MRRTTPILAMAMAAAAAIIGFASAAEQPAIRRLDGSAIAPAETDATVTRLMKAAEVSGVAIAIFNGGKIAYEKAYGFRDTEKKLPLTEDSVMTAASLSKVAAGYMEMQLVQEGILNLDKPVYEYLPKPLPEYEKYADLAGDPRYKKITARMLLSHSSGFPNWRYFNDDHKLNINFEPGSRYAYSGEGIDLLQFVVETITKKPLEDLMMEHVFLPFGMTRSSMVWQDRFESDFANGYDEYGRSLGPERRKTAAAAGSLQTTPRDFARFMLGVLNGEKLSEETRKQMLSPQIRITARHEFPTMENETTDANNSIRLSYGLGWGLFWTPYGEAFFKEGHDEGWRNYAVCFDKQKSGMLIMTNSSNGEGIFKELLETLLRDTFTPIEWEGYTPYSELPARAPLKNHKIVSVAPELLEKYAGRYGIPPNTVLIIRREGDHLSVQENDEAKQELFPESDREFFSKMADDEFTFELDAQGHVTSMTLHTGGRDIPIKRLD
jgi:CubicO group peptidase (beta-lactamase class C family)